MNILLPKGFLANGIHSGLKKKRKDLSLFYSRTDCKVAALFTTNKVKAAPVVFSEEQLENTDHVRAVIVNSGNANCMTGKRGLLDAKKMVNAAARALNVPAATVLVSSTGVIGKPMRLEPVMEGMPKLVAGLSREGLVNAAEGIMTTDRFHKIVTRYFDIGGKNVSMVGVAKGAGMINPNMATMLCYILTDVDISREALKKALFVSNERSFNAITVDGDMSTNDTLVVLANGEAGNKTVEGKGKDFEIFSRNLGEISLELAKMIVRDGEGAEKFIEVSVKKAKTPQEAKKAADAIANSLLVKCAVHGGDPNWGRIASSVGASGIDFDPETMDITLDGVTFFKNGRFMGPGKRQKKNVFKGEEVKIEVLLHRGKAEAVTYTCDISKKYIAINSYYTT